MSMQSRHVTRSNVVVAIAANQFNPPANETRSGRTGFSGEFSGEFSVGRAARRDVASQPAT
jgi:hypothetical protein